MNGRDVKINAEESVKIYVPGSSSKGLKSEQTEFGVENENVKIYSIGNVKSGQKS